MKIIPLALALIATLTAFPANAGGGVSGYLVDRDGNVVKNDYGDCWKTRWWTPEDAIEECDPEYFAKREEPPKATMTIPGALRAVTYFDFDDATLRPEGRERLQRLSRHSGEFTRLDAVRISGHADPIGTGEYNRELSLRRAEHARDFLVEHGVPRSAITVRGLGESAPIATCDGYWGAELIRCYQPNRRVEVELSGQRTVRDGQQ